MEETLTTLAAAIIGGLLATAGTYLLEARRERIHDKQRWDDRRLDSIVAFCRSAQVFEGAQYRRGRALHDGSEYLDERTETASIASTDLWATAVSAELLVPELSSSIGNVRAAARHLRDTADSGLETRQPSWMEAREQHQEAIRSLQLAAQETLRLGG